MSDLKFEYMRASGPGGQSVNTTDSACRVTHIPTNTQVVNKEGKSQDANKQRAIANLRQKLFEIDYNKHIIEVSQRRKTQVGSGDRSEKIRTFNFPQDRITDHRINKTEYGIKKFMGGELIDEFIDSYISIENQGRLAELQEGMQETIESLNHNYN